MLSIKNIFGLSSSLAQFYVEPRNTKFDLRIAADFFRSKNLENCRSWNFFRCKGDWLCGWAGETCDILPLLKIYSFHEHCCLTLRKTSFYFFSIFVFFLWEKPDALLSECWWSRIFVNKKNYCFAIVTNKRLMIQLIDTWLWLLSWFHNSLNSLTTSSWWSRPFRRRNLLNVATVIQQQRIYFRLARL